MADIMQRRNSPLVKIILIVAGFGSVVYLIYLNHDANTKFKTADERAERYRRSQESVSAQLQVMFDHKSRLEKSLLQEKVDHKNTVDDLSAAKVALEKKLHDDKEEMNRRLSAKSKEASLLQAQFEEMRSDFDTLKSQKDKLQQDHENLKVADNREYDLMKTEKDLAISSLHDQVEDLKRQIERLKTDIQQKQVDNQNLVVEKNTAVANVTKLHQDVIQLKAISIAANTSLTNLQAANKELQAAYEQSQQLVANLQQQQQAANLKVTISPNKTNDNNELQFAQNNPAANVQGNQAGFQQPLGGAIAMNQNQNLPVVNQNAPEGQGLPQGGVVVDNNQPLPAANVDQEVIQKGGFVGQNPPPGGAAAANLPVDGAAEQNGEQKEGVGAQPFVPDVHDEGNLQIKPANFGINKPVGYDHDAKDHAPKGADEKRVVEHKDEDDAQHQVLPPNLNPLIDNDGINHKNPHDQKFAHLLHRGNNLDDFDQNMNQLQHDNHIQNQGREPDFGNQRGEGPDLGEEEEEENNDLGDRENQNARQFMEAAHPNQMFAPRNNDQDNPQQGGNFEKESYYEEEDEEGEDEDEDEGVNDPQDYGNPRHQDI